MRMIAGSMFCHFTSRVAPEFTVSSSAVPVATLPSKRTRHASQGGVTVLLVHREAIKQPDAAPADQIPLAAAGGGVRRVPRLVPVADAIGMADLRGARAVARPVVARVVGRVG